MLDNVFYICYTGITKGVKTMYKIILEPIGEIWEFKLKEDLRDILTLAFSELQKLGYNQVIFNQINKKKYVLK